MEIQGKIAVVTGAASGIGRFTAIALAREGADLVLADLNRDGLAEVRNEIEAMGRRGLAVPTDVTKLKDIQNLYDRSISEMGQVDILMNNAGVHMTGPVEKMAVDDWKWIVDINLWGVVNGIHVFLPHMLDRGSGHIVNTASSAGLAGGLDRSIPYTMTKFAVVGLSEGLAVYLRNKGIGVTMICPGMVSTNIAASERFIPAGDGHDESRLELLKASEANFKQGKLPDFITDFISSRGGPSAAALATIVNPERLAEETVRAIRENTFLVVMPGELMELVKERSRDMEGYIHQAAQMKAEWDKLFEAIFTHMERSGNQPGSS
ncbi:MAG: SDR family NAD(P)-dependent oxidoreductase [Syntrophobacteraceae bacterium]